VGVGAAPAAALVLTGYYSVASLLPACDCTLCHLQGSQTLALCTPLDQVTANVRLVRRLERSALFCGLVNQKVGPVRCRLGNLPNLLACITSLHTAPSQLSG
jgi:hypothetical protein